MLFGADGVPITLPLESISWISSVAFRLAFAPFVVPLVNGVFVRLGNAARPAPPVPNTSGVSSIHSAVACVELYGAVVENDWPVVTSFSWMFQTFDPATVSVIEACMWSFG